MGVSIGRSPEHIARDFIRRLQGNARILYAAAEKRANAYTIQHDKLDKSLAGLVGGVGELVHNLRGEHRASLSGKFEASDGEERHWYGTATMTSISDDEVAIELHNIPIKHARKIMAVLADIK